MAWVTNKDGILELVTEDSPNKTDELPSGAGGVPEDQKKGLSFAALASLVLAAKAGIPTPPKTNGAEKSKVTCKDKNLDLDYLNKNVRVENRNGVDYLVHTKSGFSVTKDWPGNDVEVTEEGFKIVNKNNEKDFAVLSDGKVDLSNRETAFSTDIRDNGTQVFAMTNDDQGEISYATVKELPAELQLKIFTKNDVCSLDKEGNLEGANGKVGMRKFFSDLNARIDNYFLPSTLGEFTKGDPKLTPDKANPDIGALITNALTPAVPEGLELGGKKIGTGAIETSIGGKISDKQQERNGSGEKRNEPDGGRENKNEPASKKSVHAQAADIAKESNVQAKLETSPAGSSLSPSAPVKAAPAPQLQQG
jgi:hypothetical protein